MVNTVIQFTVHGQPQPAGSKRGFYNAKTSRVIITDASAKSRPWKALVSDAAVQAMAGETLLDGPLMLGLEFYVPRPKGHYGKRGLLPSAPAIPTVKPDLLKLARGVEDALTGIVYRDDAQIAREILDKFYGEPARVEVRVRQLDATNSEVREPVEAPDTRYEPPACGRCKGMGYESGLNAAPVCDDCSGTGIDIEKLNAVAEAAQAFVATNSRKGLTIRV